MATRRQVPRPVTTPRRARRTREHIREQLLDAALAEFATLGYDGASTRAIARRADAHQPQINYHFASKEALWTAAVDHLFGMLRDEMGTDIVAAIDEPDIDVVADRFAAGIRRFVHFAARHPELNQIMVHEATASSSRLEWMARTHVQPLYDTIRPVWRRLRAAGIASPIDDAMFHYVLVGAASLPYVNAAEVRLLTGRDPTEPDWVEAHADGLVATLLPGAPDATAISRT
jgi:AcrR family transcriptional regulator